MRWGFDFFLNLDEIVVKSMYINYHTYVDCENQNNFKKAH